MGVLIENILRSNIAIVFYRTKCRNKFSMIHFKRCKIAGDRQLTVPQSLILLELASIYPTISNLFFLLTIPHFMTANLQMS